MVKSLARRPEGGMAIVDISEPFPQPGDVLVDVAFSAVNDMDVGVRAGEWKEYVDAFLTKGPTVTGFEFTGVAASDGQRIRRGDRVAGYTHVLSGPRTHARRIAVSEDDITVLPAKLGFAEGAALISMGLTAIEILEGLKPLSSNSRILVLGAAGGVGVYCVQLAKRQGAKVTAFCSAANADWIRGQGADEVRAYETTSPFAASDAFDLVVDAPAKWTFLESKSFLSADGMYITTNPFADEAGFKAAESGPQKAGYLLMFTTTSAKLDRLFALEASGALKPAIDSEFPLDRADAAFDRYATRGKQGRVLLRLTP